MKPFFKEKNIAIYNEDCLDVLKSLDTKEMLLFTDPPYGIGEASGKNKGRSKWGKAKDYGNKSWDNEVPPPEYFEHVLNHTKDQIIFGGNYFTDWLRNTPCWIIWDKLNSGDFADCELAWTSFETAVRKFSWRWNGMIQQDMSKKEERFHPTQKPVGLAKLILDKYYDRQKYSGVIDSHMGSGSFGVACKQLSIPYIGIDRELEYCETARERLCSLTFLSELKSPKEKKGFLY